MPVREFRSTDPGAPTLSGTVGALLSVLDACLTIGRLFTTANDSSFNDHSVEARTDGGTAFTLFPTPGTSDRAYFGAQVTFSQITFDLATVGSGGAYQWEYRRSDATWQSLTVTDGTAGFTQDGTVTFTPPADWATVSVNGVTMYYVRVRPTSAPSTNPTVNYASIFGWTRPFSGTNKAVYRALTGARLYYRVDDSGPGAGGAREARLRGYETMSDVDTGTGDFPTVAQLAAGIIPRKSATANTTARTWRVVADHRTCYVFCITGDGSSEWFGFSFGEFYSFVSGDLYNGIVRGRTVENSALLSDETLDRFVTSTTTVVAGAYVCRPYTGVGTSLNVGVHTDNVKAGGATRLSGTLQYPNGAEAGIYIAPVWIHETAAKTIRGWMRGFWCFLHGIGNVQDADTFQGAGELAGRSFVFYNPSGSGAGIFTMETSNTWETN